MQIQLQAFGRKSVSLRKAITDDLKKHEHDELRIEEMRNPDRNPGWSKISVAGVPGALNIEWDASAHMLLARAITRSGNTPHKLLGIFLDYLIERHGKQITSINIQLR